MSPPLSQQKADVDLVVALNQAALRIQGLQEDIKQINELRTAANRVDRVLATYEVKLDNLHEKLEREVIAFRETFDAIRAAAKIAQETQEKEIRELKARVDASEKAALTARKQILGSIGGVIAAGIAAAAAIAVQLLSK